MDEHFLVIHTITVAFTGILGSLLVSIIDKFAVRQTETIE